MKTLSRFFLVILICLYSSCRSSKELIYLKDADPQHFIKNLSVHNIEHVLRTGDILYVSIKSVNPDVNLLFNPESNMETNTYGTYQKYVTPGGAYLYGFEIDAQGYIKLPLLGTVHVAGVTQAEAENIIQRTADKSLNDATVKVKLLNFKVTVLGEVKEPGIYYNYNNTMTVIDAIAMANGNTDFATIHKVMVVRPKPEGNMPYMLDLSSKDSYTSEAFYIHPNDYVFVQPDKHKNFQINSQAYSLIFSSLSILIAVAGFVLK
jgi:polysaccharide export outer membrane protein